MARRSSVVQLTLLPMLATAAVASIAAADPPTAGGGEPPTAGASDPPTAAPSDPPTAGVYFQTAEVEPMLTPPGMTPTIIELTCDEDPNWQLRPDCVEEDGGYYVEGGVIRGGFGGYFYGSSGG